MYTSVYRSDEPPVSRPTVTEQQTQGPEEIHSSTFLLSNIRLWHAAGRLAPTPLRSCLTRAMCEPGMLFFLPNVFFQQVMNRCIPPIDGSGTRWTPETWSAECRPAKCCSCLIGVTSASKHKHRPPRGSFPLLRLQINEACVLSLFYKSTDCKRNTETMFSVKDAVFGVEECRTWWLLSS